MFLPKTVVVGDQFCSWKKIHLTFDDKQSDGCLAVTNAKGKIVFRVLKDDSTFRSRRTIVDRSGNHVMSLQPRAFTLHHRWQAFTRDSSNSEDLLLFTVKRRSMFRHRTEFEVFLASNTSEEVADFKIEGSYKKKACTVNGESSSSNNLAKMSRGYRDGKSSVSNEGFGVMVNRRMDKAFVTALVVILCEVKKREKKAANALTHLAIQGLKMGTVSLILSV